MADDRYNRWSASDRPEPAHRLALPPFLQCFVPAQPRVRPGRVTQHPEALKAGDCLQIRRGMLCLAVVIIPHVQSYEWCG
jgi:hypothetical protein